VRIRRYRPSDRAAVIELFRAAMWELAPPELGGEFQSYIERAIREELGRVEEYYFAKDGQAFWVVGEERVVAMAGVERHADDAAELRRMAVEKSQRRQGIARALLAHAEDFCREAGYRRIVLSTSELQAAAMRLYESGGYRLLRKEAAAPPSHKSLGAGLARYHFEKTLA
jgi:GNAT superfamily N-acetyltransferase